MDGWALFGIVLLLLLSVFTIWHALALRKGQHQLAQGLGVGIGKVMERLAIVEAIPEVLQELNLGGVTLHPNKTVPEMIFDLVVAKITGDNTNDFNPLANLDGPTQEADPPAT